MTSKTIETYNKEVDKFCKDYLATDTESVHKSWMQTYLPEPGVMLDVGAGCGRDALYFAQKGWQVVAMEPAEALRVRGRVLTQNNSVDWIDDLLPELKQTIALGLRYDCILLSAVWMHVPATQRERAFRKLANLLKPNGILVISLRHGPCHDERRMYDVSIDELQSLSKRFGLSMLMGANQKTQKDTLNRTEVTWETVVLQLPDDGSGAFPIIRNVTINDSKASTYKLALLRSLVRIADGHPGAVMRREDNRVIIPMGLVALYWARQYKPLIDNNIQQSAVTSKGLGFIKTNGWEKLQGITVNELNVGQLFLGEQAKAMHQTLKDIAATIKNNPAKYTTYSNSSKPIFEVSKSSIPTPRNVTSLFLDSETLQTYGEFSVPENIWNLMTQYACWIEPVIVKEWFEVMKAYENNLKHSVLKPMEMAELLEWKDVSRTTTEVRNKVEELKHSAKVNCVWSHKQLIDDKYDIDHCLPFSRWPNNDLWNLLPTRRSVNNQKRDRIPTRNRFEHSKEEIVHWWESSWLEDQKCRFFTEASLSLPGLAFNQDNIEDVFEAMKFQALRVAETQQIARW